MRNYTYLSRIITELYCEDALSKCEVTTLHYEGQIESHKIWMTKRQFEAALDGDLDTRRAVEMAYNDLLERGII